MRQPRSPAFEPDVEVPAPGTGALRELVDWTPRHGVISIYLDVDRADRRGKWRIVLRDGLREIIDQASNAEHERRMATRATAERILERFDDEEQPSGPPGRCQIGFVEVAEGPAGEMWMSAQMVPGVTEVVHRERPLLEPLVKLLDDGAPVGVLAVSSERVRLFGWALGFVEEIGSWEARVDEEEWRERKAPGPPDPVHGQATSASGKDQHHQRLEANRERFLHGAGGAAKAEADRREWRSVLAFGARDQIEHVAHELEGGEELQVVDESNIVSEEPHAIAMRVGVALEELHQARERELVERAKAAALSSEGHGALGVAPTQTALELAQVEHLLLHADRAVKERPKVVDEIGEELIERAVRTDARVSLIEGDAAEALIEYDGVAALLRY